MAEPTAPVVETPASPAGDVPVVETPVAPKMYQVKVDGKTLEVDEETLISNFQLAKASHQRLQEASAKEKAAAEFGELLAKDPIAAFKKLASTPGVSKEQYRAALEQYYYSEFYQTDQMTAEQKALAERDAKIAQFEAEKKAREDAERQAEQAKLNEQYAEDLNAQIVKALETSGLDGLTENLQKDAVRRMARYGLLDNKYNGREKGYKGPNWNVIAKQVKADLLSERSTLFDGADGSTLKKILGKNVDKIREDDVKDLAKGKPRQTAKNYEPPAKKDTKQQRGAFAQAWGKF